MAQRREGDLRIATWNLERPQALDDPRVAIQRQRLQQIDADIWILTETHTDIAPGLEYEPSASQPIPEGFLEGECRTIIWSRFPVRNVIPTHDAETAICVEIELPLGDLIVYGTIIPYQHAATRGTSYRSGGENVTDKKGWELHYESIQRHESDLVSLAERFPEHYLCFGGDFNQSRDGHVWPWGRQWYGTHRGRELLGTCLSRSGLSCVTDLDFTKTGQLPSKSSVDHLCLSRGLVDQVIHVDVWQPDCVNDGAVSDHNGVYVDLRIKPN